MKTDNAAEGGLNRKQFLLLTAAAVAALIVYDMTKSIERGIVVETVRLIEKRGGSRGDWQASA